MVAALGIFMAKNAKVSPKAVKADTKLIDPFESLALPAPASQLAQRASFIGAPSQ